MKPITLQRCLLCALLLTALIIVVLFERGLLLPGDLAAESQTSYILEIAGVLMTIANIPLALKLMHFPRIKAAVCSDTGKYQLWSLIRICLLAVPLLYDVLMYYLLGWDVTLGYLALMAAAAMLYIWPSASRMEYETDQSYIHHEK